MHILHPFAVGCIGISFFDIQVFGQLSKNAHKRRIQSKDKEQPLLKIV